MFLSYFPSLQPEMCLVFQHLSFALRHAKYLYIYTFNVNSIEVGFFFPQQKDSKQWKS